MSEIRVENIIGETGADAVKFTKGINVTGIATASNVSVGSSVTAATFHGSGASLTGIESGLTVAQQWRITSNKSVTTSQSFITSDWESVDSDGVTPVLVEALKEALAKIEVLETKVAALEG